MGTVYRAYDERLDVVRAVKVLATERASNQVQRQRFLTEARIQARLRHPNIVEVYDIEDDGNFVYLVMELVGGGSLWDRLKAEGPMPPAEATAAAAGILGALALAHELDIVHRDIKPHNILITDSGVPKLADFGVAHLPSEDNAGVTRTGVVMGTWSFMAPEQRASSRRVDPRSDIYAVAATLYTLVTGHTEPDLFDFETDSEIFRRLPEALRGVVHRATRYERDERHDDAEGLRVDLEACLPALEGVPAAPWPTISATDTPEAHGFAQAGAGGVPTTQDRPRSARSEPDKEARSGTLVPTPAEVERLLATPGGRRAGVTYSDDGHTMELQPSSPTRPELDTAEGAVELPIDASPDQADSPEPGAIGWTIDDERQLTEDVHTPDDDDEPIEATWRSAGRIRFLLFLLALAMGSAGVVAHQQGWITIDLSSFFPSDPIVVEPPATTEPPAPGEPEPEPTIPATTQPVPVRVQPAPTPLPEPEEPSVEPDPVEPDPVQPDPVQPDPAPAAASFPGLDPDSSTPNEVHKYVRNQNEQDIWDCYHSALLTNPTLEGSLEMHWGVSAGQVYSPKPLNTPEGHQDIGSCVARAATDWQYPAWFTNLPRIHTWNLKVIEQTQRLLSPHYTQLYSCGAMLKPDQLPTLGKGRLFFVLEEGWVKQAEIVDGFDHEGVQQCLHDAAKSWRLPAYGRGQYNLNLTLEMVVVEG